MSYSGSSSSYLILGLISDFNFSSLFYSDLTIFPSFSFLGVFVWVLLIYRLLKLVTLVYAFTAYSLLISQKSSSVWNSYFVYLSSIGGIVNSFLRYVINILKISASRSTKKGQSCLYIYGEMFSNIFSSLLPITEQRRVFFTVI